MKRMIGAGLAVLLLVGCTDGGGESPEPVLTPAPPVVVTLEEQAETATPTPSVVMVRGLDGEMKPRASAETIAPDEAIMATMECEPISDDTTDRIYRLHGEKWADAIQVEVGEGLEPGETWWIVAGDTGPSSSIEAMVTSLPGGGSGYHYLGSSVRGHGDEWNRWDDVHWDAERLERGQSALAKALDCLRD